MIDVQEARRIILSAVRQQAAEECELPEACGRVLAQDVISPIPLPPFNNSSMDGYALRSSDVTAASEANPICLALSGEMAAGDSAPDHLQQVLQPMHAIQIFTGALVPAGADAVIRQEDVVAAENTITLHRPVKLNENIRFQGEEVKPGDIVLQAGIMLPPAGVGVLASIGVKTVFVYARPRVGILVTGSEIVSDAGELLPGKIFDSNSYTLAAALQLMNIPVCYQQTCIDEREALRSAIIEGLEATDILLVTGGVSVGKFDYVKELSAEAGIEELFWRVKQKPGKPLFFGASADRKKLFFGLPGNPASVLVSFYEYVRPALLTGMGVEEPFLPVFKATLVNDYSKAPGLTHFLKGNYTADGAVEIMGGQGSHMMSSFARANCLLVLSEAVIELKKGDMVDIHLLPV